MGILYSNTTLLTTQGGLLPGQLMRQLQTGSVVIVRMSTGLNGPNVISVVWKRALRIPIGYVLTVNTSTIPLFLTVTVAKLLKIADGNLVALVTHLLLHSIIFSVSYRSAAVVR